MPDSISLCIIFRVNAVLGVLILLFHLNKIQYESDKYHNNCHIDHYFWSLGMLSVGGLQDGCGSLPEAFEGEVALATINL